MWKEIWHSSYSNVPRIITYKLVPDSSHNGIGCCA